MKHLILAFLANTTAMHNGQLTTDYSSHGSSYPSNSENLITIKKTDAATTQNLRLTTSNMQNISAATLLDDENEKSKTIQELKEKLATLSNKLDKNNKHLENMSNGYAKAANQRTQLANQAYNNTFDSQSIQEQIDSMDIKLNAFRLEIAKATSTHAQFSNEKSDLVLKLKTLISEQE